MKFYEGEPVTVSSAGATNNPTTSTVLASTGAIATVGNYLAYIIISADATSVINIQSRDSANAANLWEQRLYIGPNQQLEPVVPFRINFATANGELLRCMMNTAVTGNVSAAILWQKMR